MRSIIIPILATATLGACAAATPPSISASDVTAANTERLRIAALPNIALVDLPTADALFTGQLGGDVTIDDEEGYAILGDVSVTASFAGTGSMSGTVDNINLIEDGVPTQLLGGELTVSGTNPAGTFIATASGRLDAVGEDLPFRGSSAVALALTGNYRTDATVTQSTTSLLGSWGGGTVTGEFDVQSDGPGWIYATEQ